MAEPRRTPDGERVDAIDPVEVPTEAVDARPAVPRADEFGAAAGERAGDAEPGSPRREAEGREVAPTGEDGRSAIAEPTTARIDPETATRADPVPTGAEPTTARVDSAPAPARTKPAPVPPAPDDLAILQPAADDQPAAPKKGGNRLAGTAWVLLAAGLFEVLYFAALALVALLLGAPAAALPAQLQPVAVSPFAWVPVLLFFLLFELTVLLFNRAGRFAYVVASLVVGVLVYALSTLLVSILIAGSLGDANTLRQAFLSPETLLIGLVAREVMLWTGFAIGARGRRVRVRNRRAREAYRQELAERSDAAA